MRVKLFPLFLTLFLLLGSLAACGGEEAAPPAPVILSEAVYTHHFGIAFQRGNATLRDQIWAALQVLSANGTVGQIAQTWFGYDPTAIPPDETATEHLGEVRERSLIIGFDPASAPKSYFDATGALVGFDIDLARAVCDYFGWTLELLPIDWADWEMELQSGNIDALWGGISLTDRILARLYHTFPYMENRQVVVTMSDSGINNLGQMRDRSLGFRPGSVAEIALERNERFHGRLGELVPRESLAASLEDLEQGRVDAVLMDEVGARYYIRTRDADAFGGRG